jgi:acyl-CoA thioester hydrolase
MSVFAAKQLTEDQLAMLPVTHEATIGVDYLDVMGHMNVVWYLHLFNRATLGLTKQLGFDINYMKKTGSGSFALEGHVRYLSEVLVEHRVAVRTRLIDRTPKRIHLLHFMFNEDRRTLAATFENVFAHIDLTARAMSPFPAPIAARLDELLAEHEALPWDPPVCGVMRA